MFWLPHEKQHCSNYMFLARGFIYQEIRRIFILQLDIIGSIQDNYEIHYNFDCKEI